VGPAVKVEPAQEPGAQRNDNPIESHVADGPLGFGGGGLAGGDRGESDIRGMGRSFSFMLVNRPAHGRFHARRRRDPETAGLLGHGWSLVIRRMELAQCSQRG